MRRKKRIMIIGAGFLQVPAIEIAHEMGLKTIVTDYNKDAPGMKIADVPIVMSTRDIEGTVRVAREYAEKDTIDGVITVGTDASMTVAAVANALGLPGIKFENAEAATNKIKMRTRFKQNNVPSPDFSECWNIEDIYNFLKSHSFPVVLKPSDNMGARGVIKIESMDEVPFAFRHAKQGSPSGELIVEEYMSGPELSIDALIFNNKIKITGIADRIIEREPYFIETGHIMPSNLPKEVLNDAVKVMKKGIKALGITVGAAKGDIKITEKGAMIGEIAARLSGGFMSAYTYPLATGVNLIQAAIKIALGEIPADSELKPKYNRVAVEKAIIPKSGYIKNITGIETAEKLKNIKLVYIRVKKGDIFKQPSNNVEKAGNVIGVGRNRSEALQVVDKAISLIKIDIGPLPTIDEKQILNKARKLFKNSCFVCDECNGKACRGLIPGMGSVGTGETFVENVEAFKKYKIITHFIHNVTEPDISVTIFGYKLNHPILAAPITGTDINMDNAIDESEYDRIIVDSFRDTGSIAMVGDGADPLQYLLGLNAIEKAQGWGIPIFKPREKQDAIIERLKKAEKVGSIAVGCDIDAANFITFKLLNQPTSPKSRDDIKELVKATKLPFILKGIMSVKDALFAAETGAAGIVVSNHGGRVLDSMPATIDVLPEIVKAVGKELTIFIDGGIRSGVDIFKALALGADAVLIGRPVSIYAVGGGIDGVKLYLNKLIEQLKEVMILTGAVSIKDISPYMIKKI